MKFRKKINMHKYELKIKYLFYFINILLIRRIWNWMEKYVFIILFSVDFIILSKF